MSVYFAQRENLIKIGWSDNVHNRMGALQAKLIGSLPGGRTTEAAMHKRFAHLHVQGEWFEASGDLLAYIREKAQIHVPDGKNIQTAIRLTESMIARADSLAKMMSRPGRKCTRSDVLRVAILDGLTSLEIENKEEIQ